MKKKRLLKHTRVLTWSHHEETVAALRKKHPGKPILDLGVGPRLLALMPNAPEVIAEVESAIHAGASLLLLGEGLLVVEVFAMRREDNRLDVGTAEDFAEIGWGRIVEALRTQP